MTQRQLKVLISAYACEPNKGSEPADGWNWVRQMSRWHRVWVITRANNGQNIESVPEVAQHPNIRWVYYDLPGWARFWKKGSRNIQLYYYLWQIGAWRVGARLHREVDFNLFHHVTFGQYWIPSHLGLLPIKSIIGPVGGGESTPPALANSFGARGRKFERRRDFVRKLAGFNPVLRKTLSRASLVAATTEETKRVVESLGAKRVIIEPQFAMTDTELDFFAKFPLRTERPFRVISIGRLLHWKGFHLGLQAFARFQRQHPDSEYWIVSDGPEAMAWRKLAADLGIARQVTFWGRLPNLSDVFEKLAQADVVVHPATHEAFGNACLEGLAAGRPAICLNTGGPSLQVTEACGFKAPITSLEATLQSMAEAMTTLYRNPDLRLKMGQAARERARVGFHWPTKGEQMNTLYQEVVWG